MITNISENSSLGAHQTAQKELTIQCDDATELAATLFPTSDPRGTIILSSALGIPRQFYKHFAKFISRQGYSCLTFDFRGVGDSLKSYDIELADWGRIDTTAVISFAQSLDTSKNKPIFYIGHSISGQVLGLAKNTDQLSGIMLVASSSPHWSRWPMPGKISMLFKTYILLPGLCINRKLFPAKKLGLSTIDLPSAIISQWAKWMRDPNYLFGKRFGLDTQGYAQIDLPILAFGFDDDDLAPLKNIDALLTHFSNAKIEKSYIQHNSIGIGPIGHVGFFKKKSEDSLWSDALNWFNNLPTP